MEKIHTVEENKRNDKAHGAIALQLVEAPTVSRYSTVRMHSTLNGNFYSIVRIYLYQTVSRY